MSECIFAEHAPLYWAKGWHGIIPLPAGRKAPPPDGWTGAKAPYPSYADLTEWIEQNPSSNIGLRLHEDQLGLDVDNYHDKQGGKTLAELEAKLGPLPPTFITSSRDDGVSGIRQFRVPRGLAWRGSAGPGIDVIQYRHRFEVAPPSIHPETGRPYRWTFKGEPCDIPRPEDIPYLPDAWIDYLTNGRRLATDITKAAVDKESMREWLNGQNGVMCPEVRRAAVSIVGQMAAPGARHDAMARGVMYLAHLSEEGHYGIGTAIGIVRRAFVDAISSGTAARASRGEAEAEFGRSLEGAVGAALAATGAQGPPQDPCVSPLGAEPVTRGPVGASETRSQVAEGNPTSAEKSGPENGAQGSVPAATDEGLDEIYLEQAVQLELERIKVRELARQRYDEEKANRRFHTIPRINLEDELRIPPEETPFIISEIMPAHSNIVLAAQYKTGKTTLLANLARALADGTPVFDRFDVLNFKGKVGYWDYELNRAMMREWLRSQCIKNPDRIELAALRGLSLPLTNEVNKEKAIQWILDAGLMGGVLILDPTMRAYGGVIDENSNSDVARFTDAVDEIKERSGLDSVILAAHTGRDLTQANRARGATRLDDWADVRWMLTKNDGGIRKFQATGRDVEVPRGQFKFDLISRVITLVEDDEVDESSRKVPDIQVANVVKQIITDNPGILSSSLEATVREMLGGITSERVREAIRKLRQQNQITVVVGEKNSRKHYVGKP